MKLTKFSKFLIGLLSVVLCYGIVYSCFSLYHLDENHLLLNTTTGELITTPGWYYKNCFTHVKSEYYLNKLSGGIIVQPKNSKIKYCEFIVYCSINPIWIKEHKQLPKRFSIPDGAFESYMISSINKFTLEELTNAQLTEIISQFYIRTLENTGYKLVKVYLVLPLVDVQNVSKAFTK